MSFIKSITSDRSVSLFFFVESIADNEVSATAKDSRELAAKNSFHPVNVPPVVIAGRRKEKNAVVEIVNINSHALVPPERSSTDFRNLFQSRDLIPITSGSSEGKDTVSVAVNDTVCRVFLLF